MNKQIITKQLFVDMDEFLLMEIERFQYVQEPNTLKIGYKVVGTTKNGFKVELYKEVESGLDTKCYAWINTNWLKLK